VPIPKPPLLEEVVSRKLDESKAAQTLPKPEFNIIEKKQNNDDVVIILIRIPLQVRNGWVYCKKFKSIISNLQTFSYKLIPQDSVGHATLDVESSRIIFHSPGKYHLDEILPFPIDIDSANARFVKPKRILIVKAKKG
jgi:hypothetical protein